MLLGEPQATQADLHFRIFGFPVRVHPFFWIVSLLMGLHSGPTDPLETLLWVGVVFVSVLLHELGHASVQRFYGGHPWITLYSFGGLASCNDGPRTPWRRILVLLAGPGAGFLFAAVILLGLNLAGHPFSVGSLQGGHLFTLGTYHELNSEASQPEGFVLLGKYVGYFEAFRSTALSTIIGDLIYVNVFWGILNLLPIYPLDGGQIARELFNLQNPRYGTVTSLQLSAGIAVLIAAYALLNQHFYIGLMFGYLAYSNFQSLQFNQNRWR